MRRGRAAIPFTVLIVCAVAAGVAADVAAGEDATSSSTARPYARVRVALPASGALTQAAAATTISAPAIQQQPAPADAPSPFSPSSSLTADPAADVSPAPQIMATLFGAPITTTDILKELWRQRGQETFDWLIGRGILERELDRLGLTIEQAEIDARFDSHLANLRAAFPGVSRTEDLTRAASGMSLAEYRERTVWAELALRKIMRSALPPTEEQLRGYYAERQADFIQPERTRISMVFVAPDPAPDSGGIAVADDWLRAERQILEAHSRLKMGEDFAVVARAYGSGGQLSRWVERGELLRELEDAAFSLGVGSFTTPIKSPMGYHMLQVEEREEREVPPFAAARERVLAQYEEARFVSLAGEFMLRLRDKAVRDGWLVYPDEPAIPFTEPAEPAQ